MFSSLAVARYHLDLRRYFASGWACLLPYAAAFAVFRLGHLPSASLFTVFWLLHVLHVTGAALVAVQQWHRWGSRRVIGFALPWVLLGVFHLAPGPYLEFPADGWEHLRRITIWTSCEFVDQHPEPTKAAYFFIYSLWHITPEGAQFAALALYGAGVSLLLDWVSYRLARALGFDRRFAFVAALVHGLVLGNNTFSFLRYYGLSSTPWAQIAVVALLACIARWLRRSPPFREALLRGAGLAFVIYWSHRQGFAQVAVGTAGMLFTVLVRTNRRLVVAAALAMLAAALLWLLGPSSLAAAAREQHWLNRWYGVDLLNLTGPAFARANQILGLLGWINVLAALLVWRRYPLLAALTCGPLLLLLHPVSGYLLAHGLAEASGAGFLLFHRVLLVIPNGFAVVALAGLMIRHRIRSGAQAEVRGVIATAASIVVLAILPGGHPVYNRWWHSTAVVPEDLALRNLDRAIAPLAAASENRSAFLVGSPTALFVWEIRHPQSNALSPLYEHRLYHYPRRRSPVDDLNVLAAYRANPTARNVLFIQAAPTSTDTAGSTAARLSAHWNPYEVALSASSDNPLHKRGFGSPITDSSGSVTTVRK